jgi:hypothetical protein
MLYGFNLRPQLRLQQKGMFSAADLEENKQGRIPKPNEAFSKPERDFMKHNAASTITKDRSSR